MDQNTCQNPNCGKILPPKFYRGGHKMKYCNKACKAETYRLKYWASRQASVTVKSRESEDRAIKFVSVPPLVQEDEPDTWPLGKTFPLTEFQAGLRLEIWTIGSIVRQKNVRFKIVSRFGKQRAESQSGHVITGERVFG